MTHAGGMTEMITRVLASEESRFYLDYYRKNNFSASELKRSRVPRDIPLTSRETLAATPFLERIYTTRNLFTKITCQDDIPLLIGRTEEDIRAEDFGVLGQRPLVLFGNVYEGIEKGLWAYTRNILPLISENNLDISAKAAVAYGVDSIIGGTEELKAFTPRFPEHNRNMVTSVSIVDVVFDAPFVHEHFQHAQLSLVLGMPETGSIAHACQSALKKGAPVFHPDKNTILEFENTLLITRMLDLPTPIIRYDTKIAAQVVDTVCDCSADISFTVT